jgi:ATP-dependent Clp protease adaptor protein ClpS
MVGVAQLVEHWLVVPVAAGSSPVIHPMFSRLTSGTTVSDVDVQRETSTESRISPDVPWQTVVWNDPVNLMAYVTHVFRSYFGYPKPEAERLMLQVHHDGRAIVATGPREEMERHTEAMHEFGLWATVDRAGS